MGTEGPVWTTVVRTRRCYRQGRERTMKVRMEVGSGRVRTGPGRDGTTRHRDKDPEKDPLSSLYSRVLGRGSTVRSAVVDGQETREEGVECRWVGRKGLTVFSRTHGGRVGLGVNHRSLKRGVEGWSLRREITTGYPSNPSPLPRRRRGPFSVQMR